MRSAIKEKIITEKNSQLATELKFQIKNRIEAMGTNVRALERKAGLTPGVVNNILQGASTNPTAETLIALATALGCSIDELLSRTSKPNCKVAPNSQVYKWDADLYSSIVAKFNKQLKTRNVSISSDSALALIQDLYIYCIEKDKKAVEENLIEWLLDKAL